MADKRSSEARIYFDRSRWPEEAAALERIHVPGLLCIGLDLADAPRAIGEIVNARRRGQAVAVLMVYVDPFEQLLLTVHTLLDATTDADSRAIQAKALREGKLTLKGQPLAEHAKPSHAATCAASVAVRLADLVLVGTTADRQRLEELSDTHVRRWGLLPDPVPPRELGESTVVTVYGPNLEANLVNSFALALERRNVRVQAISAANAGDRIAGATVVIPEFWRGYRARTIAASGRLLVVPEESGAEAFSSGVTVYRMTDLDTVADAIAAVSSVPSSAAKLTVTPDALASTLSATLPAETKGALVSIVVRTMDRPRHLRRALASIAAQTYNNIEIVLVNNGTAEVPDAVLPAALAVPIKHVRPAKPVKLGEALNLGMRAAAGQYVGYLDDDDILYPDHCAHSIALLERTGADFCYSKSLGEYARVDASGKKTVAGVSIYTDRPYRLDALFEGNLTTIHSAVHRRELFERFGYVDESLPVTEDWELWLRMAIGGAYFVHLDRTTCEYSWRDDASTPNTSTERLASFATAYEMILERHRQLVANRPETIGLEQANVLAHLRRRAEAVAVDPSMGIALTMQDLMMLAVQVEGLTEE